LKSKSDEREILQNSSAESAPESAAETPVTPAVTSAGKTEGKVILKQGQTLRLLALEHLGNREFWVYIYLENKHNIPNPNLVPIGTELIIPDPLHYSLNASDPHSVEKAKVLGEKMLKSIADEYIR